MDVGTVHFLLNRLACSGVQYQICETLLLMKIPAASISVWVHKSEVCFFFLTVSLSLSTVVMETIPTHFLFAESVKGGSCGTSLVLSNYHEVASQIHPIRRHQDTFSCREESSQWGSTFKMCISRLITFNRPCCHRSNNWADITSALRKCESAAAGNRPVLLSPAAAVCIHFGNVF